MIAWNDILKSWLPVICIATGCATGLTEPQCTIEFQPVECSIAFVDLEVAHGRVPKTGGVARTLCKERCAADPNVSLSVAGSALYEFHECYHSTTISGLSCDNCDTLSDVPVTQFYCDNDACTVDSCAGTTCTHTPYSWSGAICQVGDCEGVLQCDAQKCYGFCSDKSKLQACVVKDPGCK